MKRLRTWMRRAFIEVVTCTLYYSGLLYVIGLARRWLGRRRLVILMYHHVSSTPADQRVHEFERGPGGRRFDGHMRVLKWFGQVVDLTDGARALAEPEGESRTQIAITFDDGYRDNLSLGVPAMLERGMTGTVFVTVQPQQTRRRLWWDEVIDLVRHARGNGTVDAGLLEGIDEVTGPLESLVGPERHLRRDVLCEHLTDILAVMPMAQRDRVLDRLHERLATGRHTCRANGEYLSWEEMELMANLGIGIGGHTVHHPCLPAEPAYVAQREISQGRQVLQEQLERPVTTFCYPGGRFSRRVRDQVELAGYEVAVTTQEGVNHPGADPLMLRRVPISWDAPRHVALKLALYDFFHR